MEKMVNSKIEHVTIILLYRYFSNNLFFKETIPKRNRGKYKKMRLSNKPNDILKKINKIIYPAKIMDIFDTLYL
jgi:hypothetical protein